MSFELIIPNEVLLKAMVQNEDEFEFKREIILTRDRLAAPISRYTSEHRVSLYTYLQEPYEQFIYNNSLHSLAAMPLLSEIVSNAMFHGPENELNIYVGLYVNKFMKLVACNDGGTYFKNLDVKKKWELGLIESDRHILPGRIGGRLGQQRIYRNGENAVMVDISQGTLYVLEPHGNK